MYNNDQILAALNTLNSLTLSDLETMNADTLQGINDLTFTFANVKHVLAKRRVADNVARETAEHLAALAKVENTAGDFNAKMAVFRTLDNTVKSKITGLCELYVHARRKNNDSGMKKIELMVFSELSEHGISDRRVFARLINLFG